MTAPAKQAELTVRRAAARDYPQMAQLAGQLGYPSKPEDIARRLEGMARGKESEVYVGELPGGHIAGWVGVFVHRTVEADAYVEVSGLVVNDRARSQGIGWRLLERAEDWARDAGYGLVQLRSNVIRERAHAFYERHGYEHFKNSKAFRKKL